MKFLQTRLYESSISVYMDKDIDRDNFGRIIVLLQKQKPVIGCLSVDYRYDDDVL